MRRPVETVHRVKARRRRLWLYAGGALVLAALTVYIFVFSRHGLLRLRELQKENERLEAELARVKRENASLREDLRRLDDPEVAEKIAREELGLVKEGDVVYRFVAPPSEVGTAGP